MALVDTTETPHRTAPRRRPRRVLTVVLLLGGALVAVAAGAILWGTEPLPGRTPAPAPTAPALGLGDPLSWAPPELEDPEVIEISSEDPDLKLDQSKDYELVMPEAPLERGLSVFGGRNVVLIGGEIRLDGGAEEGTRGIYLRDQTGTVHIEGLLLSGSSLNEGINLDQRRGAVVQLQNIRVDGVDGSRDGHHADLIQSWAGPRQLLVDGFSGTTGYQGFFLLPGQFGDQPEPELFDLRRVDLTGAPDGSAYMLWRDNADWPLLATDVWVAPADADPEDRRGFLWDREGQDSWQDVSVGIPDGGPFVPEGVAGAGYISPGYGNEE